MRLLNRGVPNVTGTECPQRFTILFGIYLRQQAFGSFVGLHVRRLARSTGLTLFRTAVPFWGQTTQISSSLPPQRDCGSKGVKVRFGRPSTHATAVKRGYAVRIDLFTTKVWARQEQPTVYSWYNSHFKRVFSLGTTLA